MTQPGPGRTLSLSTTQVVVLGLGVLLLVAGAASGGVGGALMMAGFLGFVVGLVAVFRGQLPSMSIVSRRIGWAVAGVGFVALAVGGAVSPKPTAPASSQQSLIALPSSAAPTRQAVASSSVASPSTSSAAPTTPAVRALPAAPVMALSCSGGGAAAAPLFGHRIAAAAPYTVVIDYGDGDRYTNDDQHLGAIFSHSYKAPGTFTVAAVLTDAAGQTTTATCAYSWAAPAPVAAPVPAPVGGGGGSGGDTYTNVDGTQVHVPVTAPAPPAGATAKCNDGTYSFSLHHSGTCSHHGGVAEWL